MKGAVKGSSGAPIYLEYLSFCLLHVCDRLLSHQAVIVSVWIPWLNHLCQCSFSTGSLHPDFPDTKPDISIENWHSGIQAVNYRGGECTKIGTTLKQPARLKHPVILNKPSGVCQKQFWHTKRRPELGTLTDSELQIMSSDGDTSGLRWPGKKADLTKCKWMAVS